MRYQLRVVADLDTQRDGQHTAEWVAEQIEQYVRSWLATVTVTSELREVRDANAE